MATWPGPFETFKLQPSFCQVLTRWVGVVPRGMAGGSRWPLLLLLLCMCHCGCATYDNFTVGEKEGWTSQPSVPYSTWASGKNFTLGDYLIFIFAKPAYNVIHTYNETEYKSCDYMNGNGDYDVWGEPGKTDHVAIPLVQTGPNYFFCGVNDSLLCLGGMKFGINVSEGDGLPASLAIPPPAPINETSPSQPASPSGDGPSANGNSDANRGVQYMCRLRQSLPIAFIVLAFLWALSE